MNFKYLYKIHAIDTVNDYGFDSTWLQGNTRFYETYEEAEAACRKYCQDPSNEGFVIYKAYAMVKPEEKPVTVTRV